MSNGWSAICAGGSRPLKVQKAVLAITTILAAWLGNLASASSAENITMPQQPAATVANRQVFIEKQTNCSSRQNLARMDPCEPFPSVSSSNAGAVGVVKLAERLVRAGRLESAENILLSITSNTAGGTEVWLALAKAAYKSKDFARALGASAEILKGSPQNDQALLIKANCLRHYKRFEEAVGIYRALLVRKDNFDAQLGLAYALLSAGNKSLAKDTAAQLNSTDDDQAEEIRELRKELEAATKPSIALGYDYYSDSDGNRSNKYSIASSFHFENWDMTGGFTRTEARDKTERQSADTAFVKAYGKLTDTFGVGAALALDRMRGNRPTTFITGELKADALIGAGAVGASVSKEALSATAQLISKSIREGRIGVFFSQYLTERWLLRTDYHHQEYSDENAADDLEVMSNYALLAQPIHLDIGYKFKYLSFQRHTGDGYFDPSHFLSYEPLLNLSFENERFYGYLEPSVGYEAFERNHKSQSNLFGEGNGSVGVKLEQNLSLELYLEGGNYALGTANGFDYYMISPRLVFRF